MWGRRSVRRSGRPRRSPPRRSNSLRRSPTLRSTTTARTALRRSPVVLRSARRRRSDPDLRSSLLRSLTSNCSIVSSTRVPNPPRGRSPGAGYLQGPGKARPESNPGGDRCFPAAHLLGGPPPFETPTTAGPSFCGPRSHELAPGAGFGSFFRDPADAPHPFSGRCRYGGPGRTDVQLRNNPR